MNRLCIDCNKRRQQYSAGERCYQCARAAGLMPPDSRLRAMCEQCGHHTRHRFGLCLSCSAPVVPVQPAPIPIDPPPPPRPTRTITIGGIEYDVFFSGGDLLHGADTPQRFGSSLLDSSRIVR